MRYTGFVAVLFMTVLGALGLRPAAEPPGVDIDIAVTDAYDALEARSTSQDCNVNCFRLVSACGQCGHKAPEQRGGPDETGDGPHSWCFEGLCLMSVSGCMGKHAMCVRGGGFDASLAALDAADFVELNAIMDIGAGIEVLWDSGLLAFYDCANRVVASVALTGGELAALAVAEGQLQ